MLGAGRKSRWQAGTPWAHTRFFVLIDQQVAAILHDLTLGHQKGLLRPLPALLSGIGLKHGRMALLVFQYITRRNTAQYMQDT